MLEEHDDEYIFQGDYEQHEDSNNSDEEMTWRTSRLSNA